MPADIHGCCWYVRCYIMTPSSPSTTHLFDQTDRFRSAAALRNHVIIDGCWCSDVVGGSVVTTVHVGTTKNTSVHVRRRLRPRSTAAHQANVHTIGQSLLRRLLVYVAAASSDYPIYVYEHAVDIRWPIFVLWKQILKDSKTPLWRRSQIPSQWYSQALKSGWARGLGIEVQVPVRGPGAEPGWGSGAQKPDIYKQFAAVKCFLRRFVAESVLYPPYLSPKTRQICANPMTNDPCPPVATLLFLLSVCREISPF